MCHDCNYQEMLASANLEATPNRVRVLEVLGSSGCPLSAGDIFETLARSSSINRVTVYRILDRLVSQGILERLSTGGRSAYYGMGPNEHHRPHPHFYCKICGQMDCLAPTSLTIETDAMQKNFPGRIDKVEVRVDGICKNCLKKPLLTD